MAKVCYDCGAVDTPLWRHIDGEVVCNACGLYYKYNKSRRRYFSYSNHEMLASLNTIHNNNNSTNGSNFDHLYTKYRNNVSNVSDGASSSLLNDREDFRKKYQFKIELIGK